MQTDDLSERIQRAWQLLASGARTESEALFEVLRAEAPGVPSVVGLGATLLASAGDIRAAVTEFLRAFELTATGEPGPDAPAESGARFLLDAAELQMYALADPEAAVESCQRALDLAACDEEVIDGVLLAVEAYQFLDGQDGAARALISRLDEYSIDDPDVLYRAGNQHAIMGDGDKAARCLEKSVALNPEFADGYYQLGRLFETQGRSADRERVWLRTRELDLAGPRPAWHLPAATVIECVASVVEDALVELPDEIRARLATVPVVVEDAPGERQIRAGIDPRLQVLVAGQQPRAERIQVFSRNLERASIDFVHFRSELRTALLLEAARFFDLDHEELDGIGLG